MGTWGTGIFQSDYALDVKDTYMDRIRKGEDDESVMNSLIAEYEREGDFNYDDTRYVFWLALAYIQWKTGRLDPMVKERALSCIQDDPWIRRYKSLPLQNRHQVRHHLENNPYPEVLLRSCGECPWKSFLLVDFRCIFCAVPRYLVSWCFPPLRGLYHRIHKNYAEDHLLRALDIIFSYISSRETRLWLK